MDIDDLKVKLAEANISPFACCINCKNPVEQYCLMQENNIWSVYYSERGRKINEVQFKNESDTCEYFYNEFLKDPTTRIRS